MTHNNDVIRYANLKDGGRAALKVMTSDVENSWVAMLKQGATMTMEMWNAAEKPNLTWSHPWASSPAFLVAWFLFGIRALAPGFSKVAIHPQPGDLAHGSYTLPTTLGPITVSFKQLLHGGGGGGGTASIEMQVSLPSGCAGEVSVPLAQLSHLWVGRAGILQVLHNGKLIRTTAVSAKDDGGGVQSVVIKDVHPGEHTFAATLQFPEL